jgi:hypothetical protein
MISDAIGGLGPKIVLAPKAPDMDEALTHVQSLARAHRVTT